jgi:uncharacterized repeat protein (TIGR01451 family)
MSISAPVEAAVNGPNFTVTVAIDDVEAVDSGTGVIEYYGFQSKVTWNAALIDFVSDTYLPPPEWTVPNCGASGGGVGLGFRSGGCVETGGPTHVPPGPVGSTTPQDVHTLQLKCIAPGTSSLVLVPLSGPEPFGAATLEQLGGAKANTYITPVSITCKNQADVVPSKSMAPSAPVAGSLITYTVGAHNIGPKTATGVVVADALPAPDNVDITGVILPQPGEFSTGDKIYVPTVDTPCTPYTVYCSDPDGDDDAAPIMDTSPLLVDMNGDTTYEVVGLCPHFLGAWPINYAVDIDDDGNDDVMFSRAVICPIDLLNIAGGGLPLAPPSLTDPNLTGGKAMVIITARIPLHDAGKADLNLALGASTNVFGFPNTIDPDTANVGCDSPPLPYVLPDFNAACNLYLVPAANIDISKLSDKASYVTGDTVTWTVTLNSNGVSPASNVVIGDTVDPNQLLVSATLTGASAAAYDCDETGSNLALLNIGLGTAKCTLEANGGGSTPAETPVVGEVKMDVVTTVVATANFKCVNTGTVTWADGPTGALGDTTGPVERECVPPVANKALDKGSGVYPAPINVLVGQTARVRVWEQVEIQDPGPNPYLLHNWTAGDSNLNVVFDWIEQGTDTDVNGAGATFVYNNEAINFKTGPHPFGLVVVSRELDVKCLAATGVVPVSVGIATSPSPIDSDTSFTVQCFNQPQEVKSPNQANLWIMRHPNCLNPVTGNYDIGPCVDPKAGLGWLQIDEVASAIADADSPNDADSNPEGLGAYEKQIKFDHKLVNLTVEDAGFLGSTQRAVNCNLTIVTENWIMFGCVSTGSPDGPVNPGPVTLSTVSVYPASDLVERIRPTKDNGVVTPLLDENCEWADKFGDPMLGMVNGGLVPVCGDATLTIRMLEGDVNLDCNVDVLDEQGIAFRYGASFGLLLYDQWFDLEPKLADFDIDIKDLQFIFGRDGSTCSLPIPLQPPSPPIP